jgi:ABC-type multidrug transport system fused ATPase/permease subunit
VAFAVLMGVFVDAARRGDDAAYGAAVAMGFLTLCAALARVGAAFNIESAIAHGIARLRVDTFGRLLRKDLDALGRVGFDEVHHRLTDGVEKIREAMRLLLADFVLFGLSTVLGLVVVMVIDPLIPLISLVVYLPYIAVRHRLMFRLGLSWNEHLRAYPGVVAVVRESIEGIRAVKTHAAAATELDRLDRVHVGYLAAIRRHLKALCTGGFLNHVMFLLPEGLVYLYVGNLVLRGDATIGELLTVIAIFPFFRQVVWHASRMAAHRAEHSVHIGRLKALAALPDEAYATAAGDRGPDDGRLAGTVEFRDVTVVLDGQRVLADLDLTVRPGRRVAVVGLSGAGKSTLANLLVGVRTPDRGEVLVDDRPLRDWDIDRLRRRIAYITQEINLLNASIRANLGYGLEPLPDARLHWALDLADLGDFVATLPDGLDTVIGERGIQLSGGQRQRLSIARAYLRDPRILVLDETTSALDVESESRVRRAQERLGAGRTTIVIAHRLGTVRDADEIVVIEDGRISERGRHDELVGGRGLYADLHRRQHAILAGEQS